MRKIILKSAGQNRRCNTDPVDSSDDDVWTGCNVGYPYGGWIYWRVFLLFYKSTRSGMRT